MKLTKFALYELSDYGDGESGPIPRKDWLGFYDSHAEAEQARDEIQREWEEHIAFMSEGSDNLEDFPQKLDFEIEEEQVDAEEYAKYEEECRIAEQMQGGHHHGSETSFLP